jgi:AraC family transcriptional regulator of adaptative response/methylated-DNA-[protein]-cysteine methyltransferase
MPAPMATHSDKPTAKVRAPTFASDRARWQAVSLRDARADGRFVYAVATTGIYCRPSCPSRRPLPRNVAYFAAAPQAEAAGYRPCRRCRPDGAAPAGRRGARIARLCRLIDAAESMPPLSELARAAHLSRYHLSREFKAVTGITPREYFRRQRQQRLTQTLQGAPRITDALHAAGYGSSGRFYAESTTVLGMSPRQFRAGAAGLEIRYATSPCSLGIVLAAATDRGLCAILLGDDPQVLLRDLIARFAKATLTAAPAGFARQLASVVRLIEQPRQAFDLPLDIRGTAFQQRVWAALRQIPPGDTASYAQIAGRIRAPRAVRAVAQACAANPLAVVVPCHRVLRSDGALSGYRWGVERKRELLRREAKK